MDYGTEIINITKIKEGFFIGDKIAGTSIDVLIQFKISHMINAAGTQILNQFEAIGVKYLTLNWADNQNQILFDPKDEIANRIVFFVDEAINTGEGLLAYSLRGQKRVCIVVIIYLMRKYNWSLMKCLDFLHSKKQDISIPKNALSQLTNFELRLSNVNKIKSINWFDINIKDADEYLMRNTYVNGLSIQKPNNNINNNNDKKEINKEKTKRVGWGDSNPYNKPNYLINFNQENDLFLKKDIPEITIHVNSKPLKSSMKQNSNKIFDEVKNLSVINPIKINSDSIQNNENHKENKAIKGIEDDLIEKINKINENFKKITLNKQNPTGNPNENLNIINLNRKPENLNKLINKPENMNPHENNLKYIENNVNNPIRIKNNNSNGVGNNSNNNSCLEDKHKSKSDNIRLKELQNQQKFLINGDNNNNNKKQFINIEKNSLINNHNNNINNPKLLRPSSYDKSKVNNNDNFKLIYPNNYPNEDPGLNYNKYISYINIQKEIMNDFNGQNKNINNNQKISSGINNYNINVIKNNENNIIKKQVNNYLNNPNVINNFNAKNINKKQEKRLSTPNNLLPSTHFNNQNVPNNNMNYYINNNINKINNYLEQNNNNNIVNRNLIKNLYNQKNINRNNIGAIRGLNNYNAKRNLNNNRDIHTPITGGMLNLNKPLNNYDPNLIRKQTKTPNLFSRPSNDNLGIGPVKVQNSILHKPQTPDTYNNNFVGYKQQHQNFKAMKQQVNYNKNNQMNYNNNNLKRPSTAPQKDKPNNNIPNNKQSKMQNNLNKKINLNSVTAAINNINALYDSYINGFGGPNKKFPPHLIQGNKNNCDIFGGK